MFYAVVYRMVAVDLLLSEERRTDRLAVPTNKNERQENTRRRIGSETRYMLAASPHQARDPSPSRQPLLQRCP